MRLSRLRGMLRLKQGGNVKTMGGRFDRANFTLRAAGNDGEACLHGGPFVFWIDFEVAEELFSDAVLPVKRLQIRSWAKANFGNQAGELGRILLAVRHRTSHGINNDVLRAGIVFGCF